METKKIELRKVNGKSGPILPLGYYQELCEFIIAAIKQQGQITVFELVDLASVKYNGSKLTTLLLDVKEHLLATRVIKVEIIRGRNQLLSLPRAPRQPRRIFETIL
jgi:hypothetical protein